MYKEKTDIKGGEYLIEYLFIIQTITFVMLVIVGIAYSVISTRLDRRFSAVDKALLEQNTLLKEEIKLLRKEN